MEDFQVFVKPVGAACNLACAYCYYLGKQKLNGSGTMPEDLLEVYIKKHIYASTEKEIFFSWHGGEPTLAGLEFFKRVVTLQQKHLPEKRKITNGLQTNGTLLNQEWCHFLKEENFIVGISLDGPEELHSVNRIYKNGISSFQEAMRGIELLQNNEIPFEILCVVNSVNVNFPLEVYRFFKTLKVPFITFLPLVEQQKWTVSKKSVNAKSFGEFLCAVFEEWKNSDIGNIKIQIIEEALRTAFGIDHTLCVFKETCGRVPVVESNGDFYSCDHFVDKAHLIGNINNQSLVDLLENPAQMEFGQRKHTTLPDYCLSCEVLNMCNGACPKDRFIYTPVGNPGLNYFCEGYKHFFNHVKPFAEMVVEIFNQGRSSNKFRQ